MVTRMGRRTVATYAGRDFRIAIPLESPVEPAAPLPIAPAGSRVVGTLRWLGALWLEGWKLHVSAARPRRPEEL